MKTIYFIIAFCSVFGVDSYAQGPNKMLVVSDNTTGKVHYTVQKSALSSDEHTDFGSYINNGKLYFLSDRKSWPVSWTDENQQPFLDLFVVDLSSGEKAEFAGPQKNGKLNEGPICFSKDGKRVYYTRDFDGKKGEVGKDGLTHLGIFTATVKGDKWVDEKELSINNKDYSVGHPVISNNGKYLLFSSDKPGGKGGSDIYRAKILDGGDVGEVESLPGEVNTKGNELFPFIGSNNELYFSSTGHESFGGLDVFMAIVKADVYLRVVNVGYPVNSINDDFAYTQGAGNKGYFSTNRDGIDNIYSYDQIIPFRFVPQVTGVIALEDDQSKDGIIIELLDANENLLNSQVTDSKGNYSLDLQDESQYVVRYSKEGYDPVLTKVSTKGNGFGQKNDVILKKDNGIEISLNLIASKTGLAVEGATVTYTDNYTNKTFVKRLSDPSGTVSEPMLKLKEGDSLDLTIKIAKEGYLTKEVRFKHLITSMQDISLDKIYGNALKMNRVGIELGIDASEIIDIGRLEYGIEGSNPTIESMKELNKLVAFMNENKSIHIRVRTHTDSRGSSNDNLAISNKRSKAIVDYLAIKGISSSRLSSVGMGEKEIINQCRDNVNCTEEEHNVNNRTEYIIMKN